MNTQQKNARIDALEDARDVGDNDWAADREDIHTNFPDEYIRGYEAACERIRRRLNRLIAEAGYTE